MGLQFSRVAPANDQIPGKVLVNGIGISWPDLLVGPEHLRNYALKWYPENEKWYANFLPLHRQYLSAILGPSIWADSSSG